MVNTSRSLFASVWNSAPFPNRLRIHVMVIIAGSARSNGRLAPEMTLTIKRRVFSMRESIAATGRGRSAAISSPIGLVPDSM